NLTDFRYNSSRFLLLIHTSAENHLKGHTALFLCISPGLLGGIKAKHKYPILDKPTNDLTQQQPQKNQCTTTALKHIDLKGGLDRYLLTMKDDKLEKAAELDVRLLDSGNN
ncbi:18996_t:CDS:2, partial [Entrophospora sp. SA101]